MRDTLIVLVGTDLINVNCDSHCATASRVLYFNSQVHNFQKLKNISLKAVKCSTTKTKVTCLSETVFFHLHIPELLQFSRSCG